jgi:MFS family permease
MKPIAQEPVDPGIDAVYRKAMARLIPFLFVCYLFNYLDRVNVGFAKLQMLDALGMSEAVYGLGAGIFFLGYIACGLPSNLMLRRVGARRWIAAIMVLWGLLSTSLMFVRTPETFYLLRLLTGAAEAGFFPGIVLYLTQWFPSSRRGRVMTLFMSAIPISGVLGGPFSGWILSHFAVGQGGLAAWQWLFLLQGLPTVALGAAAFFVLKDDAAAAHWLTDGERAALKDDLARDLASTPGKVDGSFVDVVRSPVVWLLGLVYFCIQAGVYAVNFWLPSLIKSGGFADPAIIGWLSAIPYAAASGFMIAMGASSDRRRERRWHLCAALLVGALGLTMAAAFSDRPVIMLCGLSLATMGAMAGLALFWPLSSNVLGAGAAAAGVAVINSTGQMAGFLSPYFVGWIKDTMHGTDPALFALAGTMVLGLVLVAGVRFARVAR